MQPAILSSKMYKNCFSGSRLCSAQPRNQWASLTSRKVQDRRTHVVSRATAKELVSETDSRPQEVSRIWQHFAAKASGEWEGVTATFSPSGAPQQLPEHYVPEAFREWGVELFDWQSQCSCNAVVAEDGIHEFRSTLRRLMPTVGCEADAVAFTEQHSGGSSSSIGSSSISTNAFSDPAAAAAAGAGSSVVTAVRADGSHNIGPGVWPSKDDKGVTSVLVEHCFMLPAQQEQQQQQQQYRVKVVQVFRHAWTAGGAWRLTEVQLHKEKYDGPYTGRVELAGCGGGQPPIAQLAPLKHLEVQGNWTTAAAAADDSDDDGSSMSSVLLISKTGSTSSSTGTAVEVSAVSSCVLLSDSLAAAGGDASGGEQAQVTLLPLNTWSAVSMDSEGRLLQAEAGVLLSGSSSSSSGGGCDGSTAGSSSSRIVSLRRYDAKDGSLQEATLMTQQQQQQDH